MRYFILLLIVCTLLNYIESYPCGSSCRNRCGPSCTTKCTSYSDCDCSCDEEPESEKFVPIYINGEDSKSGSTIDSSPKVENHNNVNFTANIDITNTINNENIIHNPISVNASTYNNIEIRASNSSSRQPSVIIIPSPSIAPSQPCPVVVPSYQPQPQVQPIYIPQPVYQQQPCVQQSLPQVYPVQQPCVQQQPIYIPQTQSYYVQPGCGGGAGSYVSNLYG